MEENKPQQQWWVDAIKQLGVPTVFLCVVLIMIWRAGAWASSEVVMPLVKRQVEFIDAATLTLTETQLASAAVQQGQSQGFAGLKQLDDVTTQTATDVKRILELLKEIEFLLKSKVKAAE